LLLLVWGVFAGWLANIILGGSSRDAQWGLWLLAGVVGSFIGGLLASLISGDGLDVRPSGLLGSVVGAVIFLAIARSVSARRT
jgi:uncharacterized membrane protein YeaQ/YmgE (transglycosylase-associated protein family)